jgi:hypothetical protein
VSTNWQLYGSLEDGGSNFVGVSPTTDGGSLPNYVLEAGGLLRQTLADLVDDLAHAAGTLAFVYGDPANNGRYIKSGPAGSGEWVYIQDFNIGSSDDTNRDVAADYIVEPGVGYVRVDCTAGDVRITFAANDALLATKCRFRKKDSSTNAMLISDGVSIIHTENSNNAVGYRRAFGELVRI